MEIWKDIPNYEGKYQVSNLGNVLSLERIENCKNFNRKRNYKLLTKDKSNCGYLRVTLTKDGKSKKFSVHRLVAITYLNNYENKKFVNHKDGIKVNNNIENLEWVTQSENELHAISMKLKIPKKGEKSPCSKITEKDAISIITMYKSGNYTQKELGIIFKLTFQAISKIITKKTWKHLNYQN